MLVIRVTIAVSAAILALLPAEAGAQGLGALRKKAEDAKKRVETAVDKKPSVDTAKAKPAATASPATSSGAASASAPAASPGEAAKPNAKVWENYDFVPGNKVLFYTDFSEDKVGNFARGLKYVSGPVEIVERDGVKLLRSTDRATILIPVGRKLPERFTLELDVLTMNRGIVDQIVIEGGRERSRSANSAEIDWSPRGTFMLGSGYNAATSVSIPDAMQPQLINAPVHLRVLMDSGYFKMYVNERRMYNIPELQFRRDSVIRVEVYGTDELPVFLTSVRLAESETDVLYDALAAKGRWATQGILFATGKAEVQPESRPVLKEIASTLKQHADLRILIEGHTDNVGGSAANLALSDARAAAVKAALITDFGVAGDRITAKGLGDTKPSVPNATAAGRAQNRRVEVVKQ
jgi:OmpA-OmpF porin, OOP family